LQEAIELDECLAPSAQVAVADFLIEVLCTKSSSVPPPAGLNAIVTSDSRSGVVRGHVQVKASLRLGTTSV